MKTWGYVKAAVGDLDYRNHCVLAPTKELSAQHEAMFLEQGVAKECICLINEDTCPNPSKAFIDIVLNGQTNGRVVCATQQMYAGLSPRFHDMIQRADHWFRVMDEVPRAVDHIQRFLPKTYEVARQWLLPLLTFTDSPNHPDLVCVQVPDRRALKDAMDWGKKDHMRDDILKVFDPLLEFLLDHRQPVVEMERQVVDRLMCEPACKFAPVFGVIGVQF